MKKQKLLSTAIALVLSLAIALTTTLFVFATEYDIAGATVFEFSDSSIAVTEGNYSGYSVDGTALSIKSEGTYVVSGSCSDGSITVKKGVTGVTLVLNGLTLTSSDTAPITCNKSSGAKIIVAAGTTNTLTDAAYNNDELYPDNTNAENAVIKCKDGSQVTICGTGTLNINSLGKNGIKSGATTDTEGEAWLLIQEATINITVAVNDGINAGQLLTIESGNITVDAADDGIHSDYILNIGSQNTNGPKITVEKCYEGIEAATINIYSGDITVHSSDDCMNAANADLINYSFSLNIYGGTLYMDTTSGDGIDSNGSLTISGGTVQVWTASTADNQPLDADGTLSITGGTVLAAGGSSGMGATLSSSQGYVVFGGSSQGGMNGRPGQPGRPGGSTSSVSIASGSEFSLKDSFGNTVYSGTTAYNTKYLLFSSYDLTSGSTYTLYSGSTSVASSTAQGTTNSNKPTTTQPQTTTVQPQTTTVQPQTTTTQPQTTTTQPQTTTTQPQTTTTQPETTTTLPPTTTTQPQPTTTQPQPTTTQPQPTTTQPQTTTEQPTVIYGDCNNDGNVNLLDLIEMRKYLAKWNVSINETAADCNADGNVNLLDLILLRKYLAKWNVVLGPQK